MDRLRQFKHSFEHAFRGLVYVFKNEKNFQNEVAIGFLVVLAMFYFHIRESEVLVLVLVIMTVLIMEVLNTIMERVVDILRPRIHPYAKLIKDLMAATVLLSSILAVIVGLIIFLPYIFAKFM